MYRAGFDGTVMKITFLVDRSNVPMQEADVSGSGMELCVHFLPDFFFLSGGGLFSYTPHEKETECPIRFFGLTCA
ncbi:hypothetical protein COP2_045237 [Malus domestica]